MKHARLTIRNFLLAAVVAPSLLIASQASGQTRDELVRNDRAELADSDDWYYDDFEKATEVAIAQNKPMMVVLRCIP